MECKKKLKEDLTNCLINFDRRVLVTELLDDYKVPYEEVNNVLVDYLKEQEKTQKLKYEKRYIVHGHQEGGDNPKEIYKIVEEDKLKEWLKKLKNAESSLYSVEVAGGAKAPAAVFKPMSIEEGVKLRKGQSAKAANGAATTSSSVAVKKETKPDTKPETKKHEPQNATSKSPIKPVKAPAPKKISPKAKTPTKKSPKTEDSPTDSKKSKEKSVQKKGINNFFASAGSTKKSSEDTKDNKSTGVVKPPTPKKMQDFFKKQPEKPKSAKETKPSVNTSVQLFDDEDEEPEEVASSDEEEKLDALKRGLVSSDVEMEDEDEEATKPTTSKRRRILDSDDEEDDVPLVKHEKLDIKEESEEVKEESSPQLDETYLDDEGFVITKKPKQKGQTTTPKSITTKKSPPVTKKISPKETKKSSAKDTKATSNPPAKTKQAGIMNFFTKK